MAYSTQIGQEAMLNKQDRRFLPVCSKSKTAGDRKHPTRNCIPVRDCTLDRSLMSYGGKVMPV